MYNDQMPIRAFEIRECIACGLRYPVVEGHPFGSRCPVCAGETRVALTRELNGETGPRRAQKAERGKTTAVLLDNIRSAWNVGSILRSADAAGCDAVVVCDPVTDIFNPNVVRASTGVLFSVPLVVSESERVLAWLKAKRIRTVATTPAADKIYSDVDLRGALAVVMGSEQYGLSQFWLTQCDLPVRIPMAGQADSLNVAMATIITLFEAVRQRRS